MKNKYYCGKCEHIGMYTGSYTHSEKLCKRYAAILKVDGNDVQKCVPCICETLEAENVALRNEADENAALSMENKMRADRLEKENAALRERLSKAVELPKPFIEQDSDGYYRVYSSRISIIRYAKQHGVYDTPEAAEARLKELQGGKE